MAVRSYGQRCALARALDAVGERWALLLVRELLLGPKRFKDLTSGLPGIATNLLAERLRELERRGVIRRRYLPPPTGATVYELTAVGRSLEPALLALTWWGLENVPPASRAHPVSPSSALLLMKAFVRTDGRGVGGNYEVQLDDEVFRLQVGKDGVVVERGNAMLPDASLRTGTREFLGIVTGKLDPKEALRRARVRVEGDSDAVERLLDLVSGKAASS